MSAAVGYLVGTSLTQADVAVCDALDAIVTWVDDAGFGDYGTVERFYKSIGEKPAIAGYLSSDRRLGKKP